MPTDQPKRYRVTELGENSVPARVAVVSAAGPMQAALAVASRWMAMAEAPYAIDVERRIERTIAVAIEWTLGDDEQVRRRYAVRPMD